MHGRHVGHHSGCHRIYTQKCGQTFDDAKADHYELISQQNAELKTENDRLRGQLQQVQKLNGEAAGDALDFSPAAAAAKTGRAGLASLIKLPNRN